MSMAGLYEPTAPLTLTWLPNFVKTQNIKNEPFEGLIFWHFIFAWLNFCVRVPAKRSAGTRQRTIPIGPPHALETTMSTSPKNTSTTWGENRTDLERRGLSQTADIFATNQRIASYFNFFFTE